MAEIPQKLFFRIGEVCDLIQVQPHVLRYWETEFPTLAPQKNRAGQRVYRRKDVEMVMRIRDLLYVEKFTIAGARKRLLEEAKKTGLPRVKTVAREKVSDLERQIESDLAMDLLPDEFDESPPVEAPASRSTPAPTSSIPVLPTAPTAHRPEAAPPQASPRTQRAIRVIRHELEGLLTLLKTDANLKRPV